MVKFYLKDFYETILAYAKTRPLLSKNLALVDGSSFMLTRLIFSEMKLFNEKN